MTLQIRNLLFRIADLLLRTDQLLVAIDQLSPQPLNLTAQTLVLTLQLPAFLCGAAVGEERCWRFETLKHPHCQVFQQRSRTKVKILQGFFVNALADHLNWYLNFAPCTRR